MKNLLFLIILFMCGMLKIQAQCNYGNAEIKIGRILTVWLNGYNNNNIELSDQKIAELEEGIINTGMKRLWQDNSQTLVDLDTFKYHSNVKMLDFEYLHLGRGALLDSMVNNQTLFDLRKRDSIILTVVRVSKSWLDSNGGSSITISNGGVV